MKSYKPMNDKQHKALTKLRKNTTMYYEEQAPFKIIRTIRAVEVKVYDVSWKKYLITEEGKVYKIV